jgi:plastocyanin
MTRRLHALAVVCACMVALVGCAQQKDTGFNNLPKPAGGGAGAAKEIHMLSGNKFEPATYKAKVGEAVTWVYQDTSGQPHNAIADDGSFDSNPGCAGADTSKCMSIKGQKFSHTFAKAGTYPYYCSIHGQKGGFGMSGVVEVA